MKIFKNKIIPEVINDFNAYDADSDRLMGVTDQVTLAPVKLMTASISGAGISGTYTTPIIGHTQEMEQQIPFRILYNGLVDFMDHTKVCGITLRGGLQVTETETGITRLANIRYTVRGKVTEVNPGSMQVGNPMQASLTMQVTYMLLEVDNEKLMEIDKLNSVFVVNGTDIMAELRHMC